MMTATRDRLLPVAVLLLACSSTACGPADSPSAQESNLFEQPLSVAAKVDSLAEVCPPSRSDPLCEALRSAEGTVGDEAVAHYEQARTAVRDSLGAELGPQELTDPALRYFVRERSLSLLVRGALAERTTLESVDPDDYWLGASEVLEQHFPAYEPASAPMALEWMPTAEATVCDGPRAAVVFFPGVVRLMQRNEFTEQALALTEALPCLVTTRVESGSFVTPEVNADQAALAIAALDEAHGPLPLHLVGYSQGATNALTTLVRHPNIAARARTVLTLNAASRGSEVANVLQLVIELLDQGGGGCGAYPVFARPLCYAIAGASPQPSRSVLEWIARAMGIPIEQLDEFIAAEDQLAPAATIDAFFQAHLPGVGSLTTGTAGAFWSEHAHELPRHALYLSFRSVISDPRQNLPLSNLLGYELLKLAGAWDSHNDMQVRLVNQSLGGPIADLEVVGRVAEGNHWQWELPVGAVPESTMPRQMSEGIPRSSLLVSHFQTLSEVGLLYGE